MEGVHLADAGQVVVLDAEVALAVVEPLEALVADGANEARLLEVGVDVVVELLLAAHRLLADVAKETGTRKVNEQIRGSLNSLRWPCKDFLP